MKLTILYMLLLLAGHAAMAQCRVVTGRISDEDSRPIKGAIIQLMHDGYGYETRTDDEGYFCTKLLPAGRYKAAAVANGKYYKMRLPTIAAGDDKRLYLFSIRGGRLLLHIDGEDPFFRSQMTRVE